MRGRAKKAPASGKYVTVGSAAAIQSKSQRSRRNTERETAEDTEKNRNENCTDVSPSARSRGGGKFFAGREESGT